MSKQLKTDFLNSIFKGMDMSPEGIALRRKNQYEESQKNLENMSYWLPKIEEGFKKAETNLKIPKTEILHLSFEEWNWLRSDNYSEESILDFDKMIKSKISSFLEDEKKLFMKSGVFSNKFEFKQTEIYPNSNIGSQFLDIFYTSMLFGADNTAEIVFREFIQAKEDKKKIYNGMNLFTEFRLFYDFDEKKNIGIANYWHPEIMENNLKGTDLENFLLEKDHMVNFFNDKKLEVASKTADVLKNVNLSGKWSVDILFDGQDFWLIDMARMEKSALVNVMETI